MNDQKTPGRCPFCAGKVDTRIGHGMIMFFDCQDCGACVSFKDLEHPLRFQVPDPVAAFNRRARPRQTRRGSQI